MTRSIFTRVAVAFWAVAVTQCASAQFHIESATKDLVLDKGLVIDGIAEYARRPINTDAVVAGLADASLNLQTVKQGDTLAADHAWREIAAEGGAFDGARAGTYILMRIASDARRVMMLDASGHGVVYVNGEPRVGDPYGQNYTAIPIALQAGENTLLFSHAARGPMRATLRSPTADILIADRDLTVPDLLVGGESNCRIGVPIVNASLDSRTVSISAGGVPVRVTLPSCTIVKVPLEAKAELGNDAKSASVALRVDSGGEAIAHQDIPLKVVSPTQTHKITYNSRVDGSVQYASIVPPLGADAHPALVLSLHGAGVEATSQAASYAAKTGVLIACATNRRPYGFDWEEWGRIDAIEVLDLVSRSFATDPARVYLTGHSMGGHGTWNIGALYPQRFAAIAPSAGWLSFDSYIGAGGPPHNPDSALGRAFEAARATSNSVGYFENLKGKGIYILHGDADDNVPVEQARTARRELDKLGIPYDFHEQPGAGHWWDDDALGAACLDWPGIWKTFSGATLNAAAAIAVPPPLDERDFVKGSFKRVFDREFTLVYSTAGNESENAWSSAKARFDAEQWWYRGNGFARVMSDAEWIKNPHAGNVILYGNADTNTAWASVVGGDARIGRGEAKVNGRALRGDDLACLLALPRKGSMLELVGVIGGTGLTGMRAAERLGYFSAGVGYPSVVLMRARAWREGFPSVEAAGQIDPRLGTMVWNEPGMTATAPQTK